MTQGKNGKLGDWGIPMVFVVYVENHSHDCYSMWNPASCKITESCDVIWLHHIYYQDDVTAYGDAAGDMHECTQNLPRHDCIHETCGAMVCESGDVDSVHDGIELESESR